MQIIAANTQTGPVEIGFARGAEQSMASAS
jgi:hypothetical protein